MKKNKIDFIELYFTFSVKYSNRALKKRFIPETLRIRPKTFKNKNKKKIKKFIDSLTKSWGEQIYVRINDLIIEEKE